MRLGSGSPLSRKDGGGHILAWDQATAKLRLQMRPISYLGLEGVASKMFLMAREVIEESIREN
jgi:hypothetical protein